MLSLITSSSITCPRALYTTAFDLVFTGLIFKICITGFGNIVTPFLRFSKDSATSPFLALQAPMLGVPEDKSIGFP